jgi:hypothetical protein
MAKENISPVQAARTWFRRRFEDAVEPCPHDVTSFFFDLRLILPAGLPAGDVHRARQAVERRLHRTVRKCDRIVWSADGFFLLVATTDEARAGAAAERVHHDLCMMLEKGGHLEETADLGRDPIFAPHDPRSPFSAAHF